MRVDAVLIRETERVATPVTPAVELERNGRRILRRLLKRAPSSPEARLAYRFLARRGGVRLRVRGVPSHPR